MEKVTSEQRLENSEEASHDSQTEGRMVQRL